MGTTLGLAAASLVYHCYAYLWPFVLAASKVFKSNVFCLSIFEQLKAMAHTNLLGILNRQAILLETAVESRANIFS